MPEPTPTSSAAPPLAALPAAGWAGGAVIAFHLAFWRAELGILIVPCVFCLLQITRVATARMAFYLGLIAALLMVAPHLICFWTIFGPAAIALWLVLSFWPALFLAAAHSAFRRFGPQAVWLLPFLWTGLEFFRSELYYLRFSWLKVGDALVPGAGKLLLPYTGIFGLGFLAVLMGAFRWYHREHRLALVTGWLSLALIWFVGLGISPRGASPARRLKLTGVQLEYPTEAEAIEGLDRAIQLNPDAELLMLSEYTFDGPIPDKIRRWCREHHKFLLAGGKESVGETNYFNTAFVVNPDGEVVFRQVKCVPIQFFKDGLPAHSQQLWQSPWGPIGICICYDLSYTRVTDELVRLGAHAILVPTMDVQDWGAHQHKLHALVAPIRAAEYQIPIFRLASSGISQVVDARGNVLGTAPFPGQGEILSGAIDMARAGRVPWDRWLGWASAVIAGVLVVLLMVPRKSSARNQQSLLMI